ncbi:MAG: SLC13 family permease [Pseudomonadota bacterium]|jgi:di/tricarboxylate transporter|nr:SLC13 family permease [Pseudomonadota bacterium]
MSTTLSRSHLIALILIPLLSALLLLSPLAQLLDGQQRLTALLVVAAMVLFATGALPEFVTSLLVLVLAMLLSLAPADVVFSGLTSTACWLVFSGLVMGIAIAETGLAQRITNQLGRYLDSRYSLLITGMVLMGVLLGFVMPSSVGREVLFIPIALVLAEQCGFPWGSRGQRGVALAAAFGCHLPTFAIMPANIPNVVMIGSAEKIYGWTPMFTEYLLLHFPVLGALKAVLLIGLILKLYPDTPQRVGGSKAEGGFSFKESRLLLIMLITLGFWLTDSLHHISAAWIGLAAATVLLLPGIGMVSTKSFNAKVNISSILVVAGVLGVAGLINHSQISQVLGERVLHWLPLEPGRDALNFFSLSLMAMVTGMFTTLAGVPATLTPLAEQISQLTGFSLEAVLMTQVFGYSTIVFTYQSVPLMVAMPLAGVPIGHAARLLLIMAALTVLILLPLDYLWWRLLGWI